MLIFLRGTSIPGNFFKDPRCLWNFAVDPQYQRIQVCLWFFSLLGFFLLQDYLAVAKSTYVARFCVPALLRPVNSCLLPGVFPKKREKKKGNFLVISLLNDFRSQNATITMLLLLLRVFLLMLNTISEI